jgi:hypothetical protein
MTGKLQLPVIIPGAVIEKAQEIRKLGRAANCIRGDARPVYAFVIDDDFDIGRARYSAGHSEERLLISQVTGS